MDHNNLLFESCCNKQVETLLSLLMKNLLTNFSDVKVKKPHKFLRCESEKKPRVITKPTKFIAAKYLRSSIKAL